MPAIRTVTCTITITGTPDWVAATLQHAAVLPNKGIRMGSLGKIGAVLVEDVTRDVPQDDVDVMLGTEPSNDDGPYPETRRKR